MSASRSPRSRSSPELVQRLDVDVDRFAGAVGVGQQDVRPQLGVARREPGQVAEPAGGQQHQLGLPRRRGPRPRASARSTPSWGRWLMRATSRSWRAASMRQRLRADRADEGLDRVRRGVRGAPAPGTAPTPSRPAARPTPRQGPSARSPSWGGRQRTAAASRTASARSPDHVGFGSPRR